MMSLNSKNNPFNDGNIKKYGIVTPTYYSKSSKKYRVKNQTPEINCQNYSFHSSIILLGIMVKLNHPWRILLKQQIGDITDFLIFNDL